MSKLTEQILQNPGIERLRDWYQVGPVQRAALDEFVSRRDHAFYAAVLDAWYKTAQDIRGGQIGEFLNAVQQQLERAAEIHDDKGYQIGTVEGQEAFDIKRNDPCSGCKPGGVCRTPSCGRLKLPLDHPLRTNSYWNKQ